MNPGWIVLVGGGAAVAAAGAAIAAPALRRAADPTLGGRPTLLFRVMYAEVAALTTGREGARRSGAFALIALVAGLLLTAALSILARPLAGLVDRPLARLLAGWDRPGLDDTALGDAATLLSGLGDGRPVTVVVLLGALALGLLWPRVRWLPGAVLAAVATLAWVGAGLVDVSAPLARPAWQPSAVTAVYGSVLLLLLFGLRLRRGRGLPVPAGLALWLGFAVLTWTVAFGHALLATRVPTASATGVVLGAFVLLAAAIVAVRHSGLATTSPRRRPTTSAPRRLDHARESTS
jgi:uncharacterized membrane protein (UPF0136 family)